MYSNEVDRKKVHEDEKRRKNAEIKIEKAEKRELGNRKKQKIFFTKAGKINTKKEEDKRENIWERRN